MTFEEWWEESLAEGAVSSDEKEIAEYAFEAGQAELEKENAELKRNKKTVAHLCNVLEQIQDEKIAKTKEIIKEFMRISIASVEEYEPEFTELIGKAEQFVSEVDK